MLKWQFRQTGKPPTGNTLPSRSQLRRLAPRSQPLPTPSALPLATTARLSTLLLAAPASITREAGTEPGFDCDGLPMSAVATDCRASQEQEGCGILTASDGIRPHRTSPCAKSVRPEGEYMAADYARGEDVLPCGRSGRSFFAKFRLTSEPIYSDFELSQRGGLLDEISFVDVTGPFMDNRVGAILHRYRCSALFAHLCNGLALMS